MGSRVRSFPGWGPPRDGGFPRRESPRGLGPSDEPIKKHYTHIKEEFISPALHSARLTTSSSNRQRNYSQEVSIMSVKGDSNEDTLTFHKNHNTVTCICGEEIRGEHLCNIEITRVRVVVCYNEGAECTLCLKKANFQKYLDSSYRDRDGYEFCSYCGDHIHCCSCVAFIDMDGKKKCKNCNALWKGIDVESGECDICGYMGD